MIARACLPDGRRRDPNAAKAAELERIGSLLLLAADEMRQPSRSAVRAERIIADVERLAGEARAVVRGAA